MKLVLLAALAALAACTRPSASDLLARATWVDLTYDFDSTTIYWPTAKPFRLEVVSAQRTAAGYYYAANNIAAAEHGGTHLDAPVHFAEGKHTDRKSTRLNSSHGYISYAVFCLKKKKK